jgi:invasion protein IalB
MQGYGTMHGMTTGGAAMAAALLLGMAAPALAQGGGRPAMPPAAAPAPSPGGEAGGPERTSAQFGDWMVQCVVLPQTGRRACEMAQTVQDPQRQQPVAVVALGRAAKEQPLKLAIRVPVNVLVSAPAQLVLEGSAGEPVALAFQRCTINPVGCFAERELREDLLRRLRARPAEQAARIAWRDAGGGEAAIPVSFRGFAAAYDALLREGG